MSVEVFTCYIFNLSYEYMEDSGQAIELYSQANSLAPTDPSILTKLSNIYESEQDKTQAFQCLYDVIHLIIEHNPW